MVQACSDGMGKVESDNAKLIQKDAEENERNMRRRKEEREEKTQTAADKKLLANKRASGRKAATPTKEAKKESHLSPAANRVKERFDDQEKKKAKKEKETAMKTLNDDKSVVGDDNVELTEDQHDVVDPTFEFGKLQKDTSELLLE
jgi:hypothetical protein